MLDQIVVPLDGSALAECVLRHVVGLANAFHARVTLVRVVESGEDPTASGAVDPVAWHMLRAVSASYLTDVAGKLARWGVEAEVARLEGRASERIIAYADERDVDLVVLSSHGMSGLSGWNVCGVVHKVISRVRSSVMVVPAYRQEGQAEQISYRQVMVPLDGSQRAELVVPIAVSLAEAHDCKLLLTHVVRKPEIARHIPLTQEETELAARLTARNQEVMSAHLDGLAARLPVDTESLVLVADDVALALHEVVDRQQVDLVVLSAHGYSGARRFLHGSVASSFIHYGQTPLLVLQDLAKHEVLPSAAERATKTLNHDHRVLEGHGEWDLQLAQYVA